MPKFSSHHRSHSFPPSFHFKQDSQTDDTSLNPPVPDIDSEPWLYFLEDDEPEYLLLDAGIVAGTQTPKRKGNKFRPHEGLKDLLEHDSDDGQNGSLSQHGYVRNERSHPSDSLGFSGGIAIKQTSRQLRHPARPIFSHRPHSWQEPSPNLFPLQEEVPEIVVTDFDSGPAPIDVDRRTDEQYQNHIAVADFAETSHDGGSSEAGSPRLSASEPKDQPDSELSQMWLAERARL